MPEFNWIFIGVAALVPLLFGALWYSATVSEIVAGEKPEGRTHPTVAYVLCYVAGIPISMFLSALMSTHAEMHQVPSHIAFHGSALAVFVVLPVLLVHFLFEGDRSWRNMIYHILYWVISFGIMGAVIGAGV